MALSFVVVCEARADFLTSSEIADRVFCESVDWIESEYLDAHRDYKGIDSDDRFVTWRDIKARAKESGFRPRGFIEGQPAQLDAVQTRRVLLYIESKLEGVDGILLIRDDDRLRERRRGLEQARKESSFRERIVIGVAHTKRECWDLAGFDPCDDREHSLLTEIRQELGFDPCLVSERLTAIHDHDKRSAKRVLDRLLQGDKDREALCWRQTPLQRLRERGRESGLVAYLEEIEERLVPLFSRD